MTLLSSDSTTHHLSAGTSGPCYTRLLALRDAYDGGTALLRSALHAFLSLSGEQGKKRLTRAACHQDAW